MKEKTELQKLKVLRQNNQEANAITRECIESALVLLMEKKPFAEISVTDITRKAGVSRTAYYRNYDSKEEILGGYMQRLFRSLSKVLLQFNAITESKQSWLALLRAIEPLAPQFRLLLDAGFYEKMILEFADKMNEATASGNFGRYYSNHYWAGAILSVVFVWIRNDMDAEIEQLATIGANLLTNGIRTVTDYGNQCE